MLEAKGAISRCRIDYKNIKNLFNKAKGRGHRAKGYCITTLSALCPYSLHCALTNHTNHQTP